MNNIRLAAIQYYLDNVCTRNWLCLQDMEAFEQWLEQNKLNGFWRGA